MTEAEEVVTKFFEGWGDGTMLEVFEKYIAPNAAWYNSGLPPCEGKEAILALGRMFYSGFPRIEVEHKVLLSDGDRVLSERVDHLKAADGSTGPSVEVAGSFRVEDGRIVYWYDYFDASPFANTFGV